MGKAPAFQLYAADFYMDTVSWDVETVGVYTRLLFYQWVNGSIPNDLEKIARIAGCIDNRKWRANMERIWSELCHKFVIVHGGNLVNLRLEETRTKQQLFIEKQREKGKISASLKKHKTVTAVQPEYQPEYQPEGNSSSSSSSSNNIIKAETSGFTLPSKDDISESSEPKILTDIQEISKILYDEKIFTDVYKFTGKMLKNKKNSRAVLHALSRCYIKKPEEPFGYCMNILKVENGNFNERDHSKTA